MMKVVSSKSESKKRKRDDSQDSITEGAKKAKVHAQRKFAQGAAFNSALITPIKDKVRPPAAVSSSGPILTGKCPNTEDFLTFLCFRRTSILPAKLDFFKDGFGPELDSSHTLLKANSSFNHKSGIERSAKHSNKDIDKNEETKKVHTPAVQALRRKYKEQRLAKEKPTNVTRLAKKVKGKNMVRTRSSVVAEKPKTNIKKQFEKELKTNPSCLRSGLKRVPPTANKINRKAAKPKHSRAGLRSGGCVLETKRSQELKSTPANLKKSEKEVKKSKTEVFEAKTKLNKGKKTEGFSDFSSDDNEPLLAVKKPKSVVSTGKADAGKNQNEILVKTRSRINETVTTKAVWLRPTRKTKEAAALYMEMITKKLVSPEKSGDEDMSSVDSFPELPNAKRTEQRETEIKAKAFTSKKPDSKQQAEERTKETKKIVAKKIDKIGKLESKISKETPLKKPVQTKESKANEKRDANEEETVFIKRSSKAGVKEEPVKTKLVEGQKKEPARPSTRSRHQESNFLKKKLCLKVASKPNPKTSQLNNLEKRSKDKPTASRKTKGKCEEKTKQKSKSERIEITDSPKKLNQKEQEGSLKTSDSVMPAEKPDQSKASRKTGERKILEKKEGKVKEEKTGKKRKIAKPVEPVMEMTKPKPVEKKPEKKIKKEEENVEEISINKRPTRKCSTADKIWIDMDEFTSDEDDFLEMSALTKTRASTKKSSFSHEKPSQAAEIVKKAVRPEIFVSNKIKSEKTKEMVIKSEDKRLEVKKTKIESKLQEKISAENSLEVEQEKSRVDVVKNEDNTKAVEKQINKLKAKKRVKRTEVKSEAVLKRNKKFVETGVGKKEIKDTVQVEQHPRKKKQTEKSPKKVEKKEAMSSTEVSDEKKLSEIKPKNFQKSIEKAEESENRKRTRPVRQCSTGEKRWIETDSDSFSFYETSDDEDNLPIVGFSKIKSSPAFKDSRMSKEVADKSKSQTSKPEEDNFSESDEEPLKRKAHVEEALKKAETNGKNVVKIQREIPALTPIKKPSCEIHLSVNIPTGSKPGKMEPTPLSTVIPTEPKVLYYERKPLEQRSDSVDHQIEIPKFIPEPSLVSVPNKVEMILHSLKRDQVSENSPSRSSDVKVTFDSVSYQPVPHCSQTSQIPCTYQVKATFPLPREPISTHGLDLLSEVALPTTPKETISSQTKRIEKWLNDSLTVEHKNRFHLLENVEYKSGDKMPQSIPAIEKSPQEAEYYFGKSVSTQSKVCASSHSEFHKFGQMELLESQKLLKKNLFASEVKQDLNRVEQPYTPKKTVTSVQDLLKLQKERKEVAKTADNAPHSKNCKCNNCIVKKGWFKNKPVPKTDHQKSPPADEEGSKPFESLTKAFIGDCRNSKMSVSVAPIVVSPPTTPSSSKNGKEKKGIFHQRKLTFLERMKERERKEAAAVAAAKPSPNAFSPNNESSIYAFEPEPEQSPGVCAPFRSKTRESRTSSTSRSDDEGFKICEEETSAISLGTQVEQIICEKSVKPSQSASIAVQVNLDSETVAEVEPPPELQDGKSIEISTQTEVPEEDSDSPMFYIPLQQTTTAGSSTSSDQQLIQGVALKLGTEGPMGPNQRVIMKAKLVTKPPDSPSIKAVVMPQPKRMFDQKFNNPPIGTVQPTTRKPPDEPAADKSESAKPLVSVKDSSELVSQPSDSELSKATKTPTGKPLKNKEKTQTLNKDKPEASDENTPGSSLTSNKAKRSTKQKNAESVINPTNSTWLPPAGTPSKLVEAPTFHPTVKDFQDPFEFFDRIRPTAEKFGLCRIVPPSNFKPDCKVSDDMRFTAYNQYVHRMFHRWGPNIKEMMAIKKYLGTQSISLKQPPWIGGIEVDLPRLYQSVQNCGGLMKVMEKKKWHQVADMMKIPKAAQDRVTKLDDIYCKYLLPYDTLSHDERQNLFNEVEKDWEERQKAPVESPDSQEDEETEENYIEECEECVVKGRNMALNQFYRIARNTMSMWFRNPEPSPREVETEFWKHVSERNHHVCVHSGSIDSSGWGYGFPIAKNNSFSKHPWNLKVLTNNSGSVLRYLGPVMGVTVPTLHVGMVFTAFCWYRDPHGLPWIEYLHTGAPKIWYGISDDNSTVFQEALTKLLPRYIKNKTIWLPSDTGMIPPELLVEHGVSLCHTVQEPGQFILVFPRAFTSSICTGYLVSESVYFAQLSWLATAEQVFKDIQESCEPSMFSLEKLLFSIATDSRSGVEVLKQVLPMVWHVRQKELDGRKTLFNLGLKSSERLPAREPGSKKKKGRWTQEDDGDYECEICRTNLYVSLVTNSQEEGVYCLPHAIELLTQKRHQLKYCKLMYTYTQEEMNEMVEKLEQKIESKSQKKPQSKPATSTK